MLFIIQIIQFAEWLISVVVIIDVVISYFMSPYQPVRLFLDRLVQPLLRPIQRVVPAFGGMDFSPIILLLGVQVIASLLISVLAPLG